MGALSRRTCGATLAETTSRGNRRCGKLSAALAGLALRWSTGASAQTDQGRGAVRGRRTGRHAGAARYLGHADAAEDRHGDREPRRSRRRAGDRAGGARAGRRQDAAVRKLRLACHQRGVAQRAAQLRPGEIVRADRLRRRGADAGHRQPGLSGQDARRADRQGQDRQAELRLRRRRARRCTSSAR